MRHLKLTIVLVILLLLVVVIDFEYKFFVFITLAVVVLLNHILNISAITSFNYQGQFFIRQQKKSISVLPVMVNIILAIILSKGNDMNKYIALLICVSLGLNIITYVLYKIKKPYAFVIDADKLIINSSFAKSFNIEQLTCIRLNGISDTIEIFFSGKSKVIINRGEFIESELNEFIQILVNKNNHQPILSDNLKKLLVNQPGQAFA